MTRAPAAPGRDAERSRQAILEAAEATFARVGYDAARIQDIARDAGLSRETPRYFFGSKQSLYEAVLARVFERAGRELAHAHRAALEHPRSRGDAIRATIGSFIDFLASSPSFVRLVEWEALGGGRFVREVPPHVAAVSEALAEVEEEFSPGGREETVQLLVSIVGLCWVTFTQGTTILPALGVDPLDPEFLAARKEHVAALLLRGNAAPETERGSPC